jgi:N-acetylmuramoyl-L-alanine amidase
LPKFHSRRFPQPRLLILAALFLGLAAIFWPARQLRSDNFVIYFPSSHQVLSVENVGGAKFLPLLQVLNIVGKVGQTQEKKNALKIWFGSTQIQLREDEAAVQVAKTTYQLPQRVHQTSGQWMVPVGFLTTVLPHLTHQAVEYQEGTNRIFIGDVRPSSFTASVTPISNGARLTVQFSDKIAVKTASSNGNWIIFLGNHPMEPMVASYRFDSPYLSDMRYDDQDGVPKLILSPTSGGLNFYPASAEGGKILLADVEKPPATAQAAPPPTAPQPPPGGAQAGPNAQVPAVTAESPAAPLGPPLPIVVLDAGHGGDDNGIHSRDGILEKNLVAQYVARVRSALLATQKFRVVLTRTADISLASDQRAMAANVSGASCFLTFHAGDLGTQSPRVALYTFQAPTSAEASNRGAPEKGFVLWGQVQEARLEQSVQLASALQQQFTLNNNLDVVPPAAAPVRVLRSVDAPAVAIELGRLAPEADAAALTNPNFQQQFADAVAQALATFEKGSS